MRAARLLRLTAASVPVALVLLSAVAVVSPAGASPVPGKVTDRVIIVLRDQLPALPDSPGDSARRAAAVASLQRGVLAKLAQTHARDVHSITLINAIAATVSPGAAARLAADPAVARVIPDELIPLGSSPQLSSHAGGRESTAKLPPGTCAPAGHVQLDPQAIEVIHAATQSGKGDTAQALGYTGAGVKVAYIADGLDPDNPDLIRADGQHVFVDYKDFTGTGTSAPTDGIEAFLDASSIAAQGRHVYNVDSYSGLKGKCLVRILGVAPGASLVGLIAFSAADAYNSVFLEAINYAVTHDHVNVINESFGSNAFPDTASLDVTKMANDAAVRAGVTITVASGDAGPTDTIGSPATDPNVISAGATTTYRTYAQVGLGVTGTVGLPPGASGWIDNNISGLSSAGFDQSGRTVDVVAPGDLNWALCTPDLKKYEGCFNYFGKASPFELQGGTSESSPLTAGVAALVIQAYREGHHGHDPSPAVVKQIIVSTAQDVGAPADLQGAGMIDAYKAVLAARSYPGGGTAPAGHAILDSATQLNAAGQPGSTEHLSDTLTNDGAGRVTVHLSSRTLSPYRAILVRSLSLSLKAAYTKVVKFRVRRGQARLSFSVAAPAFVNIDLVAPDHDLASYNVPQGVGNYGNSQVADPAPGTWTAFVSAFPVTGGTAPATVQAKIQAATASWRSFGRLSARAVTLAAGASDRIGLTVRTPGQPGDEAGSIVLRVPARPAFAATSTIPVTLRSLVPTPDPSVTFTGTLTGGNGRQPDTGQTAYYQFTVPPGVPALNAAVSTGNPANTLFAELASPAGLAASSAVSGLQGSTAAGKPVLIPEKGAQLHVLHPQPGLWSLVIDFYNTVSGTAISQPFTVTLNDTPVPATVTGLPDTARTRLAAGVPVTATIQVTNTGPTPEAYFTDARLAGQQTVTLAPQTMSSVPLPDYDYTTLPDYLVPSHATALTATVHATARAWFDLTWPFGDPDLISTVSKTPTRTYTAAQVPDGYWILTPTLAGPFGAKAPKTGRASITVTAQTAAFNHQITAPTGDLWLDAITRSAGFTPYVVDPGQTITIPVTITPRGTPGTTITGTLYLADSSLIPGDLTYSILSGNYPEGSDIAAFPYSYTIK
jgi:hypothetical protein